MLRLLRQYGTTSLLVAALAVPLLWPVLGPAISRAISLPTQNFSQLQDLGKVSSQLRETPRQAQELTQGLVDQQLAAKGVSGSVDVKAVVEKADLSSIYALDDLSPLEKSALAQNVAVVYGQSGQLIDRSKLLSSRAAAIHQPGDGEGGGFTTAAASALSNSSQDVLTDLEQYGGVLQKTQEQLDKLKKLEDLLGVVLNLKPVFLPEKTDNDTFIVCVNYVAGGQLYPQLLTSIGGFADMNGAYSSVLSQVTTSIQRRSNVTKRLTDLSSKPLAAPELALTEKLDYQQLLKAGRASIGQQAQGVAGQVASRYGYGMEGVTQLGDVARQMQRGGSIEAAADDLSGVQQQLGADLKQRNGELVQGLASGSTEDLAKAKQALGPEGAKLVDQYQSLAASRDRAKDPATVDTALAGMRSGIATQLDAQSQAYVQQAAGAQKLAQSFSDKTPTQLMSEAETARARVAAKAGDNLDNSTALVTRLTDRKNYQETMSAELDKMQEQEDDFSYLTNLGKLLNYKEILKMPTI